MGIGDRITPEKKVEPAKMEPAADAPVLVSSSVSMESLVLPKETRAALLDFLAYKRHESTIFDLWGLGTTHKRQRQTVVNFYGPPGTGKTLAASAVGHELNLPMIMVNYADIESKYVGETSKNISRLFEDAKKYGAILFFDEADAILSRRVTNMTQATDVSVNQTRSVLLMLMNQHDGMVIFATNFIENYDPAFMRRILAHIEFSLPDKECREKLWKMYLPEKLPYQADIELLSGMSAGLSGSDISNCVLKAALAAARQGLGTLQNSHFEVAIEEVKRSKSANAGGQSVRMEEKEVSEEYVAEKIGAKEMERLKS